MTLASPPTLGDTLIKVQQPFYVRLKTPILLGFSDAIFTEPLAQRFIADQACPEIVSILPGCFALSGCGLIASVEDKHFVVLGEFLRQVQGTDLGSPYAHRRELMQQGQYAYSRFHYSDY